MLVVEGIHKSYEHQPLLRNFHFSVSQGETVCLLGPSGSGKSTLLRIIAGLEQAEVGRVLWNGQDLTNVPVHLRQFGLMFQDYALFPHRNVAQNVAFGLRMQHLPKVEIDQRVADALQQVNMLGFAQRRVTDLSGGEQQRVALARTLAPRPRLLMLDEPLGALDRALREQLVTELRELLHQTGIPTIYVTHDQEEAFRIADRMILLHHGEIEQEGTPAHIYRNPKSPWAAQFLGLTNLVSGKVVSTDPLRVETSLGTWLAQSPAGMVPGQAVNVLVRPSGASPDAAPRINVLSGQVVDSAFAGECFQVELLLVNRQHFRFNLAEGYAVGTKLTLTFAAQDTLCLPGDQHDG